MSCVPHPIDEELEPLVNHLTSVCRGRLAAGESEIQLRISPERLPVMGRIQLLLEVTLSPERASCACWTSVNQTGIIRVRFDT